MFRIQGWTRPSTADRSATRPVLRRAALIGALAALAAFAALPASALAAGPITLDAAGNGTEPLVAYDPSSGTTYVAWTDALSDSGIDLCILPSGATACAGGAPILLTDPADSGDLVPELNGLAVLAGGKTVVTGYTGNAGSVAWTSAAGGAGFTAAGQGLLNGGAPITPVEPYLYLGDTIPLGADVGIMDPYANIFADVPLTGAVFPATPRVADSVTNFSNGPYDTDGAPAIGAEPTPGVSGKETLVTVGINSSSVTQTTPTGCTNVYATGYNVRVGTIDGASNAAGTLNGEAAASQLLACSAEDPVVVSGGGAGIGVVEQEGDGVDGAGSDYQLDFHPFTATATGGSFGSAVELSDVSSQVLTGVDNLDATEDSGDGVYALWADGQGEVLDYSADSGAAWGPPVITPTPYGDYENMTGIGGGTVEIAWVANPGTGNQVYLQAVNYQSLLPKAATAVTTSQKSGSTAGADITITAGTVGEQDTATLSGSAVGSATGTATYGLFSKSDCASSSAVFSSVAGASGASLGSSSVTTVLAPGKYYWQVAYSGNTTNAASTSACGSEVLTVDPASTIGGSGSSTGSTVTVTISCASVPCTVTLTITIDPPASDTTRAVAAKKKKKPKIVTLGKGTFKIKKKGKDKLAVKLNAAGKKLLKKDHGRLKATLLSSVKIDGHLEKTSRKISITPAPKKHKKR